MKQNQELRLSDFLQFGVALGPSPASDVAQEVVEATGFEPTTAWLQTRCSTN